MKIPKKFINPFEMSLDEIERALEAGPEPIRIDEYRIDPAKEQTKSRLSYEDYQENDAESERNALKRAKASEKERLTKENEKHSRHEHDFDFEM